MPASPEEQAIEACRQQIASAADLGQMAAHLKTLRRMFTELRYLDRAWCAAAAASFLRRADAEEQRFHDQYKPTTFTRARARMTEELWKLVLDGPAARRTDEGLVLRLYGCRQSADVEATPAIEDTWFARVALAKAFREIAREHPEYAPLVIEGEEHPAKGGANFELQIIGDQHMVQVTVDDSDAEALLVGRHWRPVPPNDAAARAILVRGLLASARTDPDWASLAIAGEETPADGGLDLRLAFFGETQTLACSGAGIEPVRVRRNWAPPERDLRTPLCAGATALVTLPPPP